MIFIFNPDSDYALACGSAFYTPPKRVVELRKSMALFPGRFAEKGDTILLLDKPRFDPNHVDDRDAEAKILREKGVYIFGMLDLAERQEEFRNEHFQPWGWNHALRRVLADSFPAIENLPTVQEIDKLRQLSHRRTTIPFLQSVLYFARKSNFNTAVDGNTMPREIFSVEEAMELFGKEQNLFFKAPWSSSGRGVLYTADLQPRHVEPWLRGIIRSQGSVMAEHDFDKKIDFATEWWISNKEARFNGLSVFEASRRGKYHHNSPASQEELLNIIMRNAPAFGTEIIEMQRKALNMVIAPFYSGPVGIDMLAGRDGRIHPCIELNLRITMGMKKIQRDFSINYIKHNLNES